MPEDKKAIFLSYASQDAEAARRICDALRAAGLEVWFDQSELRGGDAWDAAIRQQVKECALFVPLISANTNARSEGYFRREWNLAVHRMLDMADDRAFLLPVVIDDTPEPAARVPDRFRERQWTRLPGGVVVGGFVERVARLLGGQPAPPVATPVATPVAAQPSAPAARAVREDEGFWIAVLPLKCRGADADAAVLAEGLTEEIITGLSRFSYLRVIARSSTLRFTGEAQDARAAGKELGARYVIEGSLRQAGSRLRLAVQVVDAVSGAHLWAENFERSFSKEAAFDLQDDLAARIVSSVADMYGVLPHSMSEVVRRKDPDTLSPYEALLRSFGYRERMTVEEHAANRVTLERAVQQAPGHADALAMLALLYTDEHSLGFNPLPDPLGRALEAARRAVDAAPSNHRAHFALAVTLFHCKEFQAFRNTAERVLALNPLDGSATEYLGICTAYSGDWDRGCALSERAMQLNPSHPGKLWYPLCVNKYRQGDYLGTLDIALRIDTPHIHYLPMLVAAANGQLGNRDAAGKALRDLLKLRPDYSAVVRDDLGKWFAPELVEHLIDGLRKAGLQAAADDHADARAPESSKSSAAAAATARGDEGFWIAVLPFTHGGTDPGLAALAEGLSEGIVTGMSRFSYLRVIARGATLKYAGESIDVRSAGRELGARYVMEGSLRQAGRKVRIAVQLVDATSGAHLWAENYERTFSADAVFELQDELVPRIVSTVADMHGVLAHGMSEALRYRALDELSPYESVLRSFGYYERMSAEEHAITRAALESAVRKAPENADAWALLSMMYAEEYKQGFNAKPDPLDRALEAARRAVTAAPSNHLAYHALATALYFRRQIPEFRNAAERAVALNPMDGNALAFMGILLAYAGEWEHGCALAERAVGLNPNFPGRYLFGAFFNAYRKGDYREALAVARKLNLPNYYYTHAATAAACGQLGDREAAGQALRELLALRPDFAASAREQYRKWFGEGELLERILDGLRKAGLAIAETDAADALTPESSKSSAAAAATARGDEGFWIAVLPFTHGGTDPGLAALADGLSEGIVTGMSRFSYLRVIARGATLKYAGESIDVRSAGRELGARYVMEGSVRQAGRKVRIAVQLVDAGSGAHLWAETYDGAFDPDSVFELQDELVPRIVATVADTNGVLPHTMGEALRGKSPEQLTTYEAVLRSFGYFERLTAEDLASARAGLELAVRRTPTSADAWAMLALLCVQDYAQFFDLQEDSLARGLAAAQRAVEIAPSNHLAHFGLAQALYFHRDLPSFANAAERAVALNPMDGNSIAFLGELLTYAGSWERGLALAGRAKQLNPNHPGYYWFADYYDAYRRGDYRGALDAALKCRMPGHHGAQAMLAAAYGQLGEREAAGRALRELLRIRPDFASILRSFAERWCFPEYGERLIDGLRKAGLEVPAAPSSSTSTTESHAPSASPSGAARVDEGFWVAVLPFRHGGAGGDIAALADALSEGVVMGMLRFPYLRVIARSSTLRYTSEAADVRAIGSELGARYVIEGTLRQAGSKVRIAVQLVDTQSGAHLWAETYDRPFSPEGILELQDELVPRIVSTVADAHGVLPRTLGEALRNRNPEELSPYEAVLRSFSYFERLTLEEFVASRTALERAVALAPGYSYAWAVLAMLIENEYVLGLEGKPDPLGRGLQAARKAVEADPSNHRAHQVLAEILFYRREIPAFRTAAKRALELNSMDSCGVAGLGGLIAYAGEWERGCALVHQSLRLNPHHPGWYWFPLVFHAYRQGDYRKALDLALRIDLPGFRDTQAVLAAVYGQLGEHEAATRCLTELLALEPQFALEVRAEFGKFLDPELVEHVIDGLRKAGLEVPPGNAVAAPVAG